MSSRADTMVSGVEAVVSERYARAAREPQAGLCCPTTCDPGLLAAIPEEVLERDYGCGDPTAHLRRGEIVLDLGSGAGKGCFMASQVVGPAGRVIGVDAGDEMLGLARRYAPEVARRIGYENVTFLKGRIQDLRLDLDQLDRFLAEHPVRSSGDLARLESEAERLRREQPLVPSESIDVVVSNCVLNLVRPEDKQALFGEVHRVLKRGGRAVISDIVGDEDVPETLRSDPDLWSGCVSGALREDRFLESFESAGFYGVTVASWGKEPWRTVEGIEFRSVTVVAHKGKEGPCLDGKHAVVYRGPFREVLDDDGHVLRRGVRTAVCEKTFEIFSREPYASLVELVPPRVAVSSGAAAPFPCDRRAFRRDPRETKGAEYRATTEAPSAACGGRASGTDGCC